jgi:hypothetical protein
MSKINLIALAIAAALASPAAFAVNVTPATPDVLPIEAMTGNTQVITNGGSIDIAASASDNYLGRSTGYNVRVTLSGGATFSSVVPAASGLNGETVTIAGGGGIGDTSVTYSVVPFTGVVQGDGIQIAAGDFQVDNAGFLANGTALSIDVRVGDPVGGNELAAKNGTSIASAVEGWVVTYNAPSNSDIRIDVGSTSGKKQFSRLGIVNANITSRYNAGSVSVALNGDLTNNMGLDPAVATAPLMVTGLDFTPFTNGGSVTLEQNTNCNGSGTPIAAVVAGNKQSASIAPATTVNSLNNNPNVCFTANNTDIISNQAISGTVTVKQATFTNSPAFADGGNALLDMAYNGAVKEVWHFNPSTNADQTSYLRVTNSSATAGLFTIDGTCDDGTSGSSVTFNLAQKHSILLTSNDIELGNATKGLTGSMGVCATNGPIGQTGKRHLTLTGEVGSMEVQNFLRNSTSAGAINTNVNDAD